MKITELLISIAIFSLVIVSSFGVYTVFMKNKMKIEERMIFADAVLTIDGEIRNDINSIKIPYWKNTDKELKFYIEKILLKNYGENIFITSVKPLRDNKENPVGLIVEWVYKNKNYVTKDLLSSKVFMEKEK